MVLEACPFCHRPFAAEQLSKEQIDSTTEDLLKDPPRIAASRWIPRSPNPTPVDFITTYKMVYRCKHCGREWSKAETEDKEVDRRVAGTEQASSTDVEMEEAMDSEERHDEQYRE